MNRNKLKFLVILNFQMVDSYKFIEKYFKTSISSTTIYYCTHQYTIAGPSEYTLHLIVYLIQLSYIEISRGSVGQPTFICRGLLRNGTISMITWLRFFWSGITSRVCTSLRILMHLFLEKMVCPLYCHHH